MLIRSVSPQNDVQDAGSARRDKTITGTAETASECKACVVNMNPVKRCKAQRRKVDKASVEATQLAPLSEPRNAVPQNDSQKMMCGRCFRHNAESSGYLMPDSL